MDKQQQAAWDAGGANCNRGREKLEVKSRQTQSLSRPQFSSTKAQFWVLAEQSPKKLHFLSTIIEHSPRQAMVVESSHHHVYGFNMTIQDKYVTHHLPTFVYVE